MVRAIAARTTVDLVPTGHQCGAAAGNRLGGYSKIYTIGRVMCIRLCVFAHNSLRLNLLLLSGPPLICAIIGSRVLKTGVPCDHSNCNELRQSDGNESHGLFS